MIDAILISLGDLAEIRAGYPFRGPVPLVEHGPVQVVQMRDITPAAGVEWSGCVQTELENRKSPDWIVPGDVLFASRGNRYYAAHVESVPGPAVCGPHLFHIRLRPGAQVSPAFLAWQINQPPLQNTLAKLAEGSSQLSIRRGVLESLPIAVASAKAQREIVAFAFSAEQEKAVYTALIHTRQKQLAALADQLAHPITPKSRNHEH